MEERAELRRRLHGKLLVRTASDQSFGETYAASPSMQRSTRAADACLAAPRLVVVLAVG